MPFTVAIVGGGISGLGSAIALSRDGHKVQLFEQRPNSDEQSGSGVQVQPSGVRLLKKWGIVDAFKKFAHESGSIRTVRQYWCLRNSFRHFLAEAAKAAGASVHFDTRVKFVDLNAPSITLEDGTVVSADVIVGSDGSNSIVRQAMYPDSKRHVTSDYVIQALVPREAMLAEDTTKHLCDDPGLHSWIGPNGWAITTVAENSSVYDVQVILHNFADTKRDPHPDRFLQPLDNLDVVGDALDGWAPIFRQTMSKASQYFKWRIVEAPRMRTALAPSGRVMLIGDAFHGMHPASGFGAAMGLEDAGALAAALAGARDSLRDVPRCLAACDRVQLERSGVIWAFSETVLRLFTLPDGPEQQHRDKMLKLIDPSTVLSVQPRADAPFGTPERQAYMVFYDPEAAVRAKLDSPDGEWSATASKL